MMYILIPVLLGGVVVYLLRMRGGAAVFPINSQSDMVMQSVSHRYLATAHNQVYLHQLTREVLNCAPYCAGWGAVDRLREFVNNLPTNNDPPDFEHVISPNEYARLILEGDHPPYSDCDDKAVLFAAMARCAGFTATVAYLDMSGDGWLEHAMGLVRGEEIGVEGPVMIETTDVNKPLGWYPPNAEVRVLVV